MVIVFSLVVLSFSLLLAGLDLALTPLGVCLQRPPLFEPAVQPPAIHWLALPSRNPCGDRVSSREGPLELRITSGRLRNSASYSGVADSVGLAAASRYTSPPSRCECWAPRAVSSSPAIE